jgi:hypothetical protein
MKYLTNVSGHLLCIHIQRNIIHTMIKPTVQGIKCIRSLSHSVQRIQFVPSLSPSVQRIQFVPSISPSVQGMQLITKLKLTPWL